jgi:hypothetical protein
LIKDAEKRPASKELLSHPFLKPNSNSQQIIKDLIERAKETKRKRAASKLGNVKSQVDEEEEEEEEETDKRSSKDVEVSKDVSISDETLGGASVPNSQEFEKMKISPQQSLPALDKKISFKAERICRLAIQVNCAEFWGNTLLFGTDDGLYAYDSDGIPKAFLSE